MRVLNIYSVYLHSCICVSMISNVHLKGTKQHHLSSTTVGNHNSGAKSISVIPTAVFHHPDIFPWESSAEGFQTVLPCLHDKQLLLTLIRRGGSEPWRGEQPDEGS